MAKVAEPRLDRSITLHMKGDWGIANLHRVLGWLSYEIGRRSGPHTRVAIWTGRGMADSIFAVARGEVDLALAVPAPFVALAMRGEGPFKGEKTPHLRAIGTVPQNDRMILAIDKKFGIKTFADLRAKKPPLRITAGVHDGVGTMGFAAHLVMEESGISDETLASWGGSWVEGERPRDCGELMMKGKADAIFQEAVMTPFWQELAKKRNLNFIPVEPAVLKRIEKRYGWPSGTLPKGYLRGIDKPLRSLDFSHFLLIARDDLPDDIAYLITWCLCETTEDIEAQYRHIPRDRSPVTYPLRATQMAKTPIPLHKGAARYYRDAGVLKGRK